MKIRFLFRFSWSHLHLDTEETLFRENSVATSLLASYARAVGTSFLEVTVSPMIEKIKRLERKENSMYACEKCNVKFSPDVKFCNNCGGRVVVGGTSGGLGIGGGEGSTKSFSPTEAANLDGLMGEILTRPEMVPW